MAPVTQDTKFIDIFRTFFVGFNHARAKTLAEMIQARTDTTNTAMLILSQDNELTCNVLDNMHRLMKFLRPNTMTNLIKNEFYNSYIGLHLIGQVNFGPPQKHNLNKWKGYFNGYGAALSGLDAFNTAQNSKFICDESDGDPCEIIPCDIYPSTLADDWFIPQNNNGSPQTECPHEIDFTGNEEDSFAALVLRPVSFTDYNEQA